MTSTENISNDRSSCDSKDIQINDNFDVTCSSRSKESSSSSTHPKYELSEKQKNDINEAFNTLDYNKNGFILTKDLKNALRALGFEPRKNDVKKITDQYDKKGTGKLSLEDFTAIMTSKLAEKDNKDEINKAFKLFDLDQSGKITFANLQQIAAELGETLTDEEIREMIQEADQDGDGMVSCDEFFRIMKKTSLY